ncbi:hypothetical protein E2320_001494, partial [Naja naja]
ELVNLLLTGRAVSNVFNDVMELDSGNGNFTLLKGISGRSDLGLLSLFEHYDSHFSVLFCLRKDLLADWRTERRFDLYYYDGLANQQEEIRLTIGGKEPGSFGMAQSLFCDRRLPAKPGSTPRGNPGAFLVAWPPIGCKPSEGPLSCNNRVKKDCKTVVYNVSGATWIFLSPIIVDLKRNVENIMCHGVNK